jgi:hypothetical protein
MNQQDLNEREKLVKEYKEVFTAACIDITIFFKEATKELENVENYEQLRKWDQLLHNKAEENLALGDSLMRGEELEKLLGLIKK